MVLVIHEYRAVKERGLCRILEGEMGRRGIYNQNVDSEEIGIEGEGKVFLTLRK